MKWAYKVAIVLTVVMDIMFEVKGASNITCFTINETNVNLYRSLVYSDQSEHPVKIPYMSWTSAQISAHMTHILLTEKMRYNAVLVPIDELVSAVAVNMVSGCKETSSCLCTASNFGNPLIHTTLESWSDGIHRASCVPLEVRPTLVNALNYIGDDSYFLWNEVVEAGWGAPWRLALDYYRSYDASAFEPHIFFDTWQRLLELLPLEVVIPCSAMTIGSNNKRFLDHYKQVTNDSDIACYDDRVWFSPSCRTNTTKCVPVLVQYFVEKIMQLAFFLNLPLAVVVVGPGSKNYAEYYNAVRRGRFIFGHWAPDDTLLDTQGRLPVLLNLPRENRDEQSRSIYRTGSSSQQLQNFVWRELPHIDPQVTYLLSSVDLFSEDMAGIMAETGALKALGADPAAASRQVACAWLKQHPDRWQQWVPAECPGGFHGGQTMAACMPCPAGAFCPGGYLRASACPVGFYCPGASSAPVPCPGHSSTPRVGGTSTANCSNCIAGAVLLPGAGCIPLDDAIPALLIPALILLAMLFAVAVQRSLVRERRLWQIPSDELTYADPPEVIGRGCHGVVVKALLRGTPVAVKNFRAAAGVADGPEWACLPLPMWAKGAVVDDGPFATVAPLQGQAKADPLNSDDLCGSIAHGGQPRTSSIDGGAPLSQRALREGMRRLAGIRHPCITAVLGVASAATGGRGSCLVMELMDLGSLWDLLQNRMFDFDAELALQTLHSVAQGLRFLHEAHPPLLHTDLKSPNVLIDRHFTAKLSDIAFPSRHAGHPRGTLHWMAPECLRGAPNTPAADVYSFGVVAYECLTRRPPYECESVQDQLAAIDTGRGNPPLQRGISAEMAALVRECLHPDPKRRPPAAEIDRRLSGWEAGTVLPAVSSIGLGDSSTSKCQAALCRRSSIRRRSVQLGGTDSLGKAGLSPAANAARPAQDPMPEREAGRIVRDMFPQHVAEALMRGERVPPERKEVVTMYFSDVVGFTSLSSELAPETVSSMLDRLYQRFDALADAHGVYKLETIGDAYLCATNVAGAQPDHAARLARFALAALAAAADTPIDPAEPTLGPVQIRVGLHSGPCMAGVVGRRNPKYTLFGDTINVASRMESSSLPGRAQCTALTAELIRAKDPAVRLAPRGRVEIKGKGTMETWWVEPPPVPGSGRAGEFALTWTGEEALVPSTEPGLLLLPSRAAADLV